jgi:hypothetical protein
MGLAIAATKVMAETAQAGDAFELSDADLRDMIGFFVEGLRDGTFSQRYAYDVYFGDGTTASGPAFDYTRRRLTARVLEGADDNRASGSVRSPFESERDARRLAILISPWFLDLAWLLCRQGVLRPGVRRVGERAMPEGGYSLTGAGRRWVAQDVPTEAVYALVREMGRIGSP